MVQIRATSLVKQPCIDLTFNLESGQKLPSCIERGEDDSQDRFRLCFDFTEHAKPLSYGELGSFVPSLLRARCLTCPIHPLPSKTVHLQRYQLKSRIICCPYLELVPLTFGKVLYECGDTFYHVCFPTDSIVSLLYGDGKRRVRGNLDGRQRGSGRQSISLAPELRAADAL